MEVFITDGLVYKSQSIDNQSLSMSCLVADMRQLFVKKSH